MRGGGEGRGGRGEEEEEDFATISLLVPSCKGPIEGRRLLRLWVLVSRISTVSRLSLLVQLSVQ